MKSRDDAGVRERGPFNVEFHPLGGKLWFCDIEMDPGDVLPVRDLRSRATRRSRSRRRDLADGARRFAQLTADRTLTATVVTAGVDVTVSGPVADNTIAPVLPALPGSPSARAPPPPRRQTHRFVGYMQERNPGSTGEMGWTKVGEETTLGGNVNLSGAATWRMAESRSPGDSSRWAAPASITS